MARIRGGRRLASSSKMTDKPISGSARQILKQLQKTKHGEHNIVIYPDVSTLNEVMVSHYRESLEERNELALLVSHYQTIDAVRQLLREKGRINVSKYESEGSLVILDAAKAYQSSEGVYALMALINLLLKRVENLGKSGMFGMADMASFFLYKRIEQLMSYELSLPSVWDGMKLRSFCLYHESDFMNLTEEERTAIVDHHYRYISIEPVMGASGRSTHIDNN